ncbi:MAG: methyltransferase [Solobacterium sp.]|nr:methyltransferase [Solobacterium sp.]
MTDILPGTDLRMIQREGFYHFNSDTELLGQFLKVRHRETLLDIGCGSGALLLYASLQKPKAMYGIDVFEEVLESARENLAYNGTEAVLICSRVQDYRERRFDVIVANPPYFRTETEDLKNENIFIRTARHEDALPLEELFASVQALLEDKGRFYLVHRPQRLNEIMQCAQAQRMSVRTLCPVYKKQNGTIRSVLLEIVRGSHTECRITEPVYR